MIDSRTNKLPRSATLLLVGLLLAACGSEQKQPPVANALAVTTAEEIPVSNKLSATSPEGDALTFELASPPLHGEVRIDAATGEFTYTPERDYTGEDSFAFSARAGNLASQPQYVRITLTPINDPPVLAAIPTLTNSPESLVVTYKLPAMDVDGDSLQVSATVDDSSIATVTSDDGELTVSILPVARGTTSIQVTVRDSEFSAEQTFVFGVGDVTKWRRVAANMDAGEAISFTNSTEQPVTLTFAHNGFPLFQSDEEMAEYVMGMPAQIAGEPFERKLWRFVRDSTYHSVPLSVDLWLHDPWAVINSGGWGFCSHVSAAFVRIARAAKYDARVWGLTGHVVPEIKVGDRWQMFDPDLSVYYYDSDLQLAGVEQLGNDPTLITAPVNAVFSGTNYTYPYSFEVASVYGSTSSNFVGLDRDFIARTPARYQPLALPPGARFTYPGRWTSAVWGVDGTTPSEVPHYLQASLLLPVGTTGIVPMPWIIWEIRGSGRVGVLGTEYDIGSPELAALLQNPRRQISEIELLSSPADVQFIFFINAMRYTLKDSNTISIRGQDVWAVDVDTTTLPVESHAQSNGALIYKKPVF